MKSSDKSITSPQLDKSNKSNQSKSGTRRNSKRGVEEEIFSSPNCMYCNGHFEALTPAEVLKKKYKIRKFLDGKQTKKDEEFFRMCILSYQMMNQKNKRMTALDPEILFNNAKKEGVQFYQYNEWVTKKGTQVLFEGMFLKE